jgi:L-rhamnose mutarotase
MQRMGMVIGLKPEHIDEYKRLHADVWPGVLKMISACNIKNYSIFLREPENLLFAYWEYHGTDFEADAARMAADPETQRWWDVCMPLQAPLETRDEGDWWATMEQVFFLE